MARVPAAAAVAAVALVAFLASCADAASVMLKMKENAMFIPIKSESVTVNTIAPVTKDIFEVQTSAQNSTHVVNATDANNEDEDDGTTVGEEDALSAVWYLAAFGGLVLFFFVVTCSELFLENPIYTRRQLEMPHAGYLRDQVWGLRNPQASGHCGPGTPPPPYHLFAPPSYEDCKAEKALGGLGNPGFLPPNGPAGCKQMIPEVFIVPVHRAACPNTVAAAAADLEQDLKAQLDAVLPDATKFA